MRRQGWLYCIFFYNQLYYLFNLLYYLINLLLQSTLLLLLVGHEDNGVGVGQVFLAGYVAKFAYSIENHLAADGNQGHFLAKPVANEILHRLMKPKVAKDWPILAKIGQSGQM